MGRYALLGLVVSGCNWMWVEGEAEQVCATTPLEISVPAAASVDESVSLVLPQVDLGQSRDLTLKVELYQAEVDSDVTLGTLGRIDRLALELEPPPGAGAGLAPSGGGLEAVNLLDFDAPAAETTRLALTQEPVDVAQYFAQGVGRARLSVAGELREGAWRPTVRACAQVTLRWQPRE